MKEFLRKKSSLPDRILMLTLAVCGLVALINLLMGNLEGLELPVVGMVVSIVGLALP